MARDLVQTKEYTLVQTEETCSNFREWFWPQMALAYRLDAISQGPKNSQIPTFPRNGYARIQNIMHGAV